MTGFRIPPPPKPVLFKLSAVENNYLTTQPARRAKKTRRRRRRRKPLQAQIIVCEDLTPTPSVVLDTSISWSTEEVSGRLMPSSPAPEQ